MVDIRQRFITALKDTAEEWKTRENVIGMFVHGSYVKGTITANSDLDICIIWEAQEAPAPLLTEHKGVRVDMVFLTPSEIEDVIEERTEDDMKIASVIVRLRNAEVVHDTEEILRKWRERAMTYVWPEPVIANVKQRALDALQTATEYNDGFNTIAASHEVRRALYEIGRIILMRHNLFDILQPSEILTEVRLLDTMTYQLFLRTFKLKGMNEERLLEILSDVDHWLKVAEERFGEGVAHDSAVFLLNQAQRDYHSALSLTYNGEFELAALEMRRSIDMIGASILALRGSPNIDPVTFIPELRDAESKFFNDMFLEHGAFEFQPKGIQRSIGEARFIADRL